MPADWDYKKITNQTLTLLKNSNNPTVLKQTALLVLTQQVLLFQHRAPTWAVAVADQLLHVQAQINQHLTTQLKIVRQRQQLPARKALKHHKQQVQQRQQNLLCPAKSAIHQQQKIDSSTKNLTRC